MYYLGQKTCAQRLHELKADLAVARSLEQAARDGMKTLGRALEQYQCVVASFQHELKQCLSKARKLPQDARQCGVVAGWESAIDLLDALLEDEKRVPIETAGNPAAVALQALRKTKTGGRNGGRPRTAPRCPCGQMTIKRAEQRNHEC